MNEQEIKKFWLNVSAYYRQTLQDEILNLYAYDCKDISIEELRKAFEKYRNSNEAKFFPIPAVLKNIMRPPVNEDAEANEVVSRIVHCLSPFKNANDAREYMGGFAWEVVRSLGGWTEFGRRPLPDSFAQRDIREMAKAKLINARHGVSYDFFTIADSKTKQIGQQTNETQPRSDAKVVALVNDTMKGKSLV